jgi:hypothetical protein
MPKEKGPPQGGPSQPLTCQGAARSAIHCRATAASATPRGPEIGRFPSITAQPEGCSSSAASHTTASRPRADARPSGAPSQERAREQALLSRLPQRPALPNKKAICICRWPSRVAPFRRPACQLSDRPASLAGTRSGYSSSVGFHIFGRIMKPSGGLGATRTSRPPGRLPRNVSRALLPLTAAALWNNSMPDRRAEEGERGKAAHSRGR